METGAPAGTAVPPSGVPEAGSRAPAGAGAGAAATTHDGPATTAAGQAQASASTAGGSPAGGGARAEPPGPLHDSSSLAGASLTASELAHASGLEVHQVEELESYGLIESRTVAGVSCFDEDALVVAGLAAGFARYGVEARHLRMFKHAAERQASMYSQIVMPLLRQRNPDARRRAQDDLMRLSELGASIQACFAKAALRDLTRG